MAVPVVLDTDIGTDVDDTWALLQLLASAELDLKLIVTTGGDTEYRAALAAKLLVTAGRDDIPIATGIRGEGYAEFQRGWLGDYSLTAYPGKVYRDALTAYREIAQQTPDLTVISIGPASNVARLVTEAPDLVERFRFVGMHGSVHVGYGGRGAPIAEANVAADPVALRTVLNAPWRDRLLTPLDTCGLVTLSGDLYHQIWNHQSPAMSALRDNYRVWADSVTWEATPPEEVPTRSSTLFDTVAVYLAYEEQWLEMETHPLEVTDDGRTVIRDGGRRVRLALSWRDQTAFERDLVSRLCSL